MELENREDLSFSNQFWPILKYISEQCHCIFCILHKKRQIYKKKERIKENICFHNKNSIFIIKMKNIPLTRNKSFSTNCL